MSFQALPQIFRFLRKDINITSNIVLIGNLQSCLTPTGKGYFKWHWLKNKILYNCIVLYNLVYIIKKIVDNFCWNVFQEKESLVMLICSSYPFNFPLDQNTKIIICGPCLYFSSVKYECCYSCVLWLHPPQSHDLMVQKSLLQPSTPGALLNRQVDRTFCI